MAGPPDYTFKLILIGDSGVGKTSLIWRLTEHDCLDVYPDFEFKSQTFEVRGKRIKTVIWDTAGQEKFRTLTSGSYRGVQGVLVVYDVNDQNSFNTMPQWLQEVKRYAQNPDVVRILVGNKIDTSESKVIATEQGRAFAESQGMQFFETSAKTNTTVQQVFETLVSSIYEHENPSGPGDKPSTCHCSLQ